MMEIVGDQKCKRLTVDEIKEKYPEYRYAVCIFDMLNLGRYTVSVCKSLEDAKEEVRTIRENGGLICDIVDMWNIIYF